MSQRLALSVLMLQYFNMGQHWCLCIVLNLVLFIYLFISGCAVLGLRCCTGLFSSRHEWGYSLAAVHRLLIAVTSVVAE